MPYMLSPSARLRRTPFQDRVEEQGVTAFTIYNKMHLPTVFRSLMDDYFHLKSAVQLWDVSVERQIEIKGPDAARLVQATTPRDLSRMADDQCYYIPTVNMNGRMTNDPVLIKLAEDRYWVSIADSDMNLYYQGLAAGMGLDVEIFEPDVHPLAIQGPQANDLIRDVFGEDIVSARFFRHKKIDVFGREMIIARSGWSLQGGFEIYCDGSDAALPLWDMLWDAGEQYDIRPGCPNAIERIEGGLLSYGNDMTQLHTPYEAGLGKFCHDTPDCLAHTALTALSERERGITPVEIAGVALPPLTSWWPIYTTSGQYAGHVSSAAWSPDFDCNVAISMLELAHQADDLVVDTPDGQREVLVRQTFWI